MGGGTVTAAWGGCAPSLQREPPRLATPAGHARAAGTLSGKGTGGGDGLPAPPPPRYEPSRGCARRHVYDSTPPCGARKVRGRTGPRGGNAGRVQCVRSPPATQPPAVVVSWHLPRDAQSLLPPPAATSQHLPGPLDRGHLVANPLPGITRNLRGNPRTGAASGGSAAHAGDVAVCLAGHVAGRPADVPSLLAQRSPFPLGARVSVVCSARRDRRVRPPPRRACRCRGPGCCCCRCRRCPSASLRACAVLLLVARALDPASSWTRASGLVAPPRRWRPGYVWPSPLLFLRCRCLFFFFPATACR